MLIHHAYNDTQGRGGFWVLYAEVDGPSASLKGTKHYKTTDEFQQDLARLFPPAPTESGDQYAWPCTLRGNPNLATCRQCEHLKPTPNCPGCPHCEKLPGEPNKMRLYDVIIRGACPLGKHSKEAVHAKNI